MPQDTSTKTKKLKLAVKSLSSPWCCNRSMTFRYGSLPFSNEEDRKLSWISLLWLVARTEASISTQHVSTIMLRDGVRKLRSVEIAKRGKGTLHFFCYTLNAFTIFSECRKKAKSVKKRFQTQYARPIQSNKTEQKTNRTQSKSNRSIGFGNRTKSNTYFAVSSIFEPIEPI